MDAPASINAPPTTAPTRKGARSLLLALFLMAMPTAPVVEEVRLQTAGLTGLVRTRTHKAMRAFGFDPTANSAITGLIELLVGFVVLIFCILIAFLLLPLVNSSSAELEADPNTTPQQKSVLPTVGLILIVCIIIMALGFMFVGFRNLVDAFKTR